MRLRDMATDFSHVLLTRYAGLRPTMPNGQDFRRLFIFIPECKGMLYIIDHKATVSRGSAPSGNTVFSHVALENSTQFTRSGRNWRGSLRMHEA